MHKLKRGALNCSIWFANPGTYSVLEWGQHNIFDHLSKSDGSESIWLQPHLSISIQNDKNCCWFLSQRHDLWFSWSMSFTIINTTSVLSAEELNPSSSNLQRQQVRKVVAETHIFQLSSLVQCAAWLVKLLLFAQLSQQGRPHNQEPCSPCTNPPLATLLLGLVKKSTYPAKVFQRCACSIVYFT